MLDYPYYEDDNKRRRVGKCTICGCNIYSNTDRYYIDNEYICEECVDQWLNQFYEDGIDADDLY